MTTRFFNDLAELVMGELEAVRAADDQDRLAWMVADLAQQLGKVVGIAGGGDDALIRELLAAADHMAAETAGETTVFFRDLVREGSPE